jgi:hypothetical protein
MTNPVTAEDVAAELTTIEECGMFVVSILGEGIDLCAQGATREQALERLALQGALEMRHAALSSTPSDTGLREIAADSQYSDEFVGNAFRAALSKAPQATSVTPCEGSVGHSDHARDDQKWCLAAGRYCKHASVQACKAPQATRSDEMPLAAFHEALRRYPDAQGALVFLWCASGLGTQEPTEEQLKWARERVEARTALNGEG